MTAVFLKILNMSITAGWIALAVMILRLLLGKMPKQLTCMLWSLGPQAYLSLLSGKYIQPDPKRRDGTGNAAPRCIAGNRQRYSHDRPHRQSRCQSILLLSLHRKIGDRSVYSHAKGCRYPLACRHFPDAFLSDFQLSSPVPENEYRRAVKRQCKTERICGFSLHPGHHPSPDLYSLSSGRGSAFPCTRP